MENDKMIETLSDIHKRLMGARKRTINFEPVEQFDGMFAKNSLTAKEDPPSLEVERRIAREAGGTALSTRVTCMSWNDQDELTATYQVYRGEAATDKTRLPAELVGEGVLHAFQEITDLPL